MGNWQMEIGRMVLYILFPVGVFHYANRVHNMEEWLYEEKESHLPTDEKRHKEFLTFIENFNKTKRLQQLEEMEQQYTEMKTVQHT